MTTISAFFFPNEGTFSQFSKKGRGDLLPSPLQLCAWLLNSHLGRGFRINIKINTLYFKARPVKYKIYGRLNMRGPHNETETVEKNLCSHEISSKFVTAIEFPLLLLYCSCLEISIAESIRKYKGLVLLTQLSQDHSDLCFNLQTLQFERLGIMKITKFYCPVVPSTSRN